MYCDGYCTPHTVNSRVKACEGACVRISSLSLKHSRHHIGAQIFLSLFSWSYKNLIPLHFYSLRSEILLSFLSKELHRFSISDELSNFPIIFINIFPVRFQHPMFLSLYLSYDSSFKPNSDHSISSIKKSFHLISWSSKNPKKFKFFFLFLYKKFEPGRYSIYSKQSSYFAIRNLFQDNMMIFIHHILSSVYFTNPKIIILYH